MTRWYNFLLRSIDFFLTLGQVYLIRNNLDFDLLKNVEEK